jgi:hypothetical protein
MALAASSTPKQPSQPTRVAPAIRQPHPLFCSEAAGLPAPPASGVAGDPAVAGLPALPPLPPLPPLPALPPLPPLPATSTQDEAAQSYPGAQSVPAVQVVRHAPASHAYGTQLVCPPPGSCTVAASAQVVLAAAHCDVRVLHCAPVAQSWSVEQALRQAVPAASHAYGAQAWT